MDLKDRDSSTQVWHRPDKPNGVGLVLTHGAGGDHRSPLLTAVANACCEFGVTVVRFDLPFRIQKRAPHPSRAGADRDAIREMAGVMRGIVTGPVVLGGHSYGGRQASMLVSEEQSVGDRLLLLSYPLHPPDKPERLRTEHFPGIRVPVLFVSGTKDEFGSPEEFERELPLIPGPVFKVWVPGAKHDLKRGKFDMSTVVEFFSGFLD